MPRISFRSLWAAARSGLLLSLLICVSSSSSSLFAQEDYERMDAEKLALMEIGDPDDGLMNSNGQQQQSVNLTNRSSGIKHNGSTLNSLQALLYSDAVSVVRVNLNKIDYESINAFVEEVVDQAGGSVQSRDQYLVDLRESQKSQVKSSFKKLASTFQNIIVKECFNNKIDEIYIVTYQNGKDPGCTVCAVPTDGLSAEDQNTALEALDSRFSPIATFKRFGFIIAVVEHDAAIKADLESIEAKFQAKLEDSQKNVYGAYTASGNRNSNVYGMTGASGVNMMGGNSQNANPQATLIADYMAEVEAAKKDARIESRGKALPFVRKRFSKPAEAGDSTGLIEALKVGDGTFLTIASVGDADIQTPFQQSSVDADVSKPFAGLGAGKAQADDEAGILASVLDIVKGQNAPSAQNVTLALSLVGSPKLVYLAKYADADTAKDYAAIMTAAITAIKPMLKDALDKQIKEADLEEPVDFTSLLNDIFTALRPEVKGAKIAVKVDLDVLKQNAAAFMPLLGGKEAKSAAELESETIDWSAADDEAESTDAKTADDDPFNVDADAEEEEVEDEDESAPSDDDEEDDPFADDDPF